MNEWTALEKCIASYHLVFDRIVSSLEQMGIMDLVRCFDIVCDTFLPPQKRDSAIILCRTFP